MIEKKEWTKGWNKIFDLRGNKTLFEMSLADEAAEEEKNQIEIWNPSKYFIYSFTAWIFSIITCDYNNNSSMIAKGILPTVAFKKSLKFFLSLKHYERNTLFNLGRKKAIVQQEFCPVNRNSNQTEWCFCFVCFLFKVLSSHLPNFSMENVLKYLIDKLF